MDGKSTSTVSPDTLADMLRGEEGTLVQVSVDDASGARRDLRLTRRRVEGLGVELAAHVQFVIEALRPHALELGLAR